MLIIYETPTTPRVVWIVEAAARLPAEADEAFLARMVAEHVPAGARHLVNPDLPADTTPERWTVDWTAGTVAVAPIPAAELAAYAAERRWHVMMAGVTVNGLQIPGDDTSQTRLTLARARLRAMETTEPISFTLGLVTVPLTLAILDQIVPALATMTQAAFDKQSAAVAGINAGTITTMAQIDAVFSTP